MRHIIQVSVYYEADSRKEDAYRAEKFWKSGYVGEVFVGKIASYLKRKY